MIRQRFVFALLFASTAAVAQESYKCKTPGGMVYQDRPCAGVRYAPDPPAGPAASPIAAPNAPVSDMERSKVYLASREKERRVGDLKEQIARVEESIAASQQTRDAEIGALRARSAQANNNLAGANLEQAMATEMQAVNSRYATDIGVKQDRLKQLRDELAQVK
jgi:hypothetical protein